MTITGDGVSDVDPTAGDDVTSLPATADDGLSGEACYRLLFYWAYIYLYYIYIMYFKPYKMFCGRLYRYKIINIWE